LLSSRNIIGDYTVFFMAIAANKFLDNIRSVILAVKLPDFDCNKDIGRLHENWQKCMYVITEI